MSDMQINDASAPSVPAQNAPTPNPATLNSGRDLAAERDAELRREQAAAQAKVDRFTVRRPQTTTMSRPPAAPEYETILLKGAVNQPLADLIYPSVSTLVPNMHVFFYILHIMDHLMCSTKRWYDNSFGWCPPISQMYFSVLIYYQIFKAMHAAGCASGEMITFLITFDRLFSASELWIPGPLVAAFRALSAFRPDANDLFGGVTVHVPNTPGHTQVKTYRLNDQIYLLLPNLNLFISRLHHVTAAALATTNDAEFLNRTDGPIFIDSLCGTPAANNAAFRALLLAPGVYYSYGGTRALWFNAAGYIRILGIPANLDSTADAVVDSWTSVLRFENNEHTWFGNVSATMAKYSQFFNGSIPLSEINPVSSAACAVKGRFTAATSLYTNPTFHDQAGTHNDHNHGNANVVRHYACKDTVRIVLDAQVALRDIPDAHTFSGLTFAYNCYTSAANQNANRNGNFWHLGPNVKSGSAIEIAPSFPATIMREYHNDTRTPAFKQ